jgi:hypothetical protein
MALCPVCFSEIGTWIDDPILCTPSLSTLEYEGYTIIKPSIHITEIQENINELEEEAGLSLTSFTPCTWKLLGIHIKEIRTAIERLLGFYESDKDTYFNYDAEGNDMRPGDHQLDWTEEIIDNQTIIRASHIEELRHPIPVNVPTTEVFIHCHNPEGKEINSIAWVYPTSWQGIEGVKIYVDNIFAKWGAYNAITHGQSISLTNGHHIISAKFNGMTLTQEIDIPTISNILTFTFTRTEVPLTYPNINLSPFLTGHYSDGGVGSGKTTLYNDSNFELYGVDITAWVELDYDLIGNLSVGTNSLTESYILDCVGDSGSAFSNPSLYISFWRKAVILGTFPAPSGFTKWVKQYYYSINGGPYQYSLYSQANQHSGQDDDWLITSEGYGGNIYFPAKYITSNLLIKVGETWQTTLPTHAVLDYSLNINFHFSSVPFDLTGTAI